MSSTANPRHPNNPPSDPPQEPTGAIAKDSLANESIKSGGAFAENNNAQALGVKGGQSTLATTDTSAADVLKPASSRAAREGSETQKYPDAGANEGFEGTHTLEGYTGGPGGASTTGARPQVDEAPNYAADSTTSGDLKPKGNNLVEGGDIPPNRSTYTGDVGGPNDPGRLAEREFSKLEADSSGGVGARQYGNVPEGGDSTAFDALNPNERA